MCDCIECSINILTPRSNNFFEMKLMKLTTTCFLPSFFFFFFFLRFKKIQCRKFVPIVVLPCLHEEKAEKVAMTERNGRVEVKRSETYPHCRLPLQLIQSRCNVKEEPNTLENWETLEEKAPSLPLFSILLSLSPLSIVVVVVSSIACLFDVFTSENFVMGKEGKNWKNK